MQFISFLRQPHRSSFGSAHCTGNGIAIRHYQCDSTYIRSSLTAELLTNLATVGQGVQVHLE